VCRLLPEECGESSSATVNQGVEQRVTDLPRLVFDSCLPLNVGRNQAV
jgi:hypothetical protein